MKRTRKKPFAKLRHCTVYRGTEADYIWTRSGHQFIAIGLMTTQDHLGRLAFPVSVIRGRIRQSTIANAVVDYVAWRRRELGIRVNRKSKGRKDDQIFQTEPGPHPVIDRALLEFHQRFEATSPAQK